MSVRVTYGRSDVDGTVPALAMLADRAEAAVLAAGDQTQVVLEFPLVPDALLVGAAVAE